MVRAVCCHAPGVHILIAASSVASPRQPEGLQHIMETQDERLLDSV